jgi:threonine dehydratase
MAEQIDSLVSLDDIRAAARTLADIARVTPLERSLLLSSKVGGPAYLKCENLQRAGSFKVRGAYTRIARLSDKERARGVVAASAGNHAQGVALAAAALGCHATVFMPTGAPLPKVEATRGYGATVELVGQVVDEALDAAQRYADETGAVYIHPFDHRDVIAGQGTVGLEILEQCPEVRTIVVAVGGGGLVSGIAAAVKALRPDVRVVGVQAEGSAAMRASLDAGEPVRIGHVSTIADGIAVGRTGPVAFAHVKELVDEVVTVSDEAISRALVMCLERAKLVVEPAGVVPVAALLTDPHLGETPVVSVLSGGNMDPLLLGRVIQHGLVSAGRYLSFRVRMPDRPGSLATLLQCLADLGGNVLEVEHHRIEAHLNLGEAEISVSVEARGPDHCDELLKALQAHGYTVF